VGVPADTVVIRNEFEICIEKAASAIENHYRTKGNSITKFNPEEIKRKQASLHYLMVLLSI
jgi:hypothetical protein